MYATQKLALITISFLAAHVSCSQDVARMNIVPDGTVRGMVFVSPNELVTVICSTHTNEKCKVVLWKIAAGILEKISSSNELTLSSPADGDHLFQVGTSSVAVSSYVLEIPRMNVLYKLQTLNALLSQDGTLQGLPDTSEWSIVDNTERHRLVARGTGRLLALSNDSAIVADKNMLTVVSVPQMLVAREVQLKKCLPNAEALWPPMFVIGTCGDAQLILSSGNRVLSLGKVVVGYDRVRESADGTRVAVIRFRSEKSLLRKIGEGTVAVATSGLGVNDEEANRADLQILSLPDGRSCYRETIRLSSHQNLPTVAMSPDSHSVAFTANGKINIVMLANVCK